MPLSEFYRMAKSKLESSQQMPTSSSADLTFLPDNEFVELVWENGPVMMQSQSSKSRKNPNSNNFPSNTTKFRDRKFGLGQQQSNLNDFSSSVPSVEAGLNQDNDLVPWLNYPIEETLDQDYGSEFLAELAGVKDNNYSNQAFRNSEQGQASDKITSDLPCLKQNSGLSSNSSGLLNFSHFSRPAAIVRANLHNLVMGNKDKGCVMAPNDRSKPSIVNSRFLSKPNLVSSNVDSAQITAKPIEELRVSEQSDVVCQKDAAKSDKSTSPDCEKTVEPVVASSVCSGNSGERASDDMTNNMKRKCRDEESECPSEDIEEESFKRGANARGGSGSKRSRAAEVHNLSERRRRDRINEKMRALQELIPNCNKVDKASMLDEAIEYLKTLQLQVQIMSMGAGLCMPPMMFPTGIQHIHFPHIPHFPSMMGMGTSYGMGMLDMNGAPRFPSPLMPGPANFQAMAGHNIPVFGHPAQGVPVSVPGAPFVHMSGCPPMNFAMAPNNSTMIQKPSQFQDQPVTAQKLDQPPPDLTTTAAVTLTKTKDNLPSKTPGCD